MQVITGESNIITAVDAFLSEYDWYEYVGKHRYNCLGYDVKQHYLRFDYFNCCEYVHGGNQGIFRTERVTIDGNVVTLNFNNGRTSKIICHKDKSRKDGTVQLRYVKGKLEHGLLIEALVDEDLSKVIDGRSVYVLDLYRINQHPSQRAAALRYIEMIENLETSRFFGDDTYTPRTIYYTKENGTWYIGFWDIFEQNILSKSPSFVLDDDYYIEPLKQNA